MIGKELSSVGMKWLELKKILPDWTPEAVAHPSGGAEIRFFLASHLGLDISADGSLRMRALPHAQFKTTMGTDIKEIAGARAIVSAVARLVACATIPPWRPLPADPALFRRQVLGNRRWIDLATLVEACWSSGVPVVYLPNLPVTGKKMEGIVTFAAGRPVILLTKKSERADWPLYVLAHEIGHLALGHLTLQEDEAIIDERVGATETDDQGPPASRDTLETEADEYATCVLTGGVRFRLETLEAAPQLARRCIEVGENMHISPGHLALNAVNHTSVRGQRPFSLANATLKCVDELTGQPATGDICRDALRRHVDTARLRDESVEFLQALGVG